MKIRTDKKILLTSGIGLGSVLLGVVMLVFQTQSKALFFMGLGLTFAGLFMFVMASHAATKPKTELIVDERVTRINEKAGNSAFGMVSSFVAVVLMADIIWSINLELRDLCIFTMGVGIYSRFIFKWYYNRRGEIV